MLLIRLCVKRPREDDPAVGAQNRRDARTALGWAAVALGALFVLFTLVSAYNPVSTKNEGIVTSFGSTSGHLSNGFHLIWPWQKVHEMDAAIQTDSHDADACINVRIANQQTGCADISIQWRINPDAADSLYKDFRSFEHVRDALVTRRLTQAMNQVLGTFNPLDSIGDTSSGSGVSKETLVALAGQIRAELDKEVGAKAPTLAERRIEVISVLMPIVKFDQATQDRINQLQQQVALTRIAKQSQKTATAQAAANRNLAASINNSPNVLVARCLDIVDAMVKAEQPVPAGLSCWPGGSSVGVLVPGTSSSKATATP